MSESDRHELYGLLLLMAAFGCASGPDPTQQRALAVLRDEGLIPKVDCAAGEGYVVPELWARMNVDQKRGTARALADSCSRIRFQVLDYQSGKPIASVTASGITIQ